MILLALGVALVLGAAWGARFGARGLDQLGRSVRGPWRPGAGFGALLCLVAALALLARAEWLFGGVLLLVAAGLAAAARRRPARPAAQPARPGLSRREAAALLGVAETAAPAEVEAAHRRLIRRIHPDAGGTAGLAAQLNAARETLLRR